MTVIELHTQISSDARVLDYARLLDNACVYDNARVSGKARVSGAACVLGTACVFGNARIYNCAQVYGHAQIYGNARVSGNALVSGDACVSDRARIYGHADVHGVARVRGDADISDPRHVLTVGPVGSEGRTVTIHRHYDGPDSTRWGHLINAGCWQGTARDLRGRIHSDEPEWVGDADAHRYIRDYDYFLLIAAWRIAEWEDAPLTDEDHKRWASPGATS